MKNKNLKFVAIAFITAFCIQTTNAQNGFGTKTPSEASALEIKSDDKGILIPRVSLTDLSTFSPISGAGSNDVLKVNSMLVFNLTNAPERDIVPGYYYWTTNGTSGSWNRLATGSDAKSQPWYVANSDDEATLNSQDIYQRGNVGIGDFSSQLISEKLDIASGNVRVRDIYNLPGDPLTDRVVVADDTGLMKSLSVLDVNKLTSLELETETSNAVDGNGDPIPGMVTSTYTLIYTDESGTENEINMNALVESTETLTYLSYDGAKHELIYTDEKQMDHNFSLVDMVGDAQTLTSLTLDLDSKRLIYTDENDVVHSLNLAPIIQEPWFSSDTNSGATSNTENIYTQGWVGIGYTSPSSAPNEKLRVNGAISAVNNYYADYVFEDYFEGFSEIKSDYKFKSIEEIETFIKVNKHLPGITPIHMLEKTEDGYSFNISELSIQLLEKTEELYLHTIQQNKQIEVQNEKINELEERLQNLEQLIKSK